MKTYFKLTLALAAGVAAGATAIEALHAQAKPPVYLIAEVDISNQDAYMNEFVPKFRAALKNAGGKIIAASPKATAIEGDAPKGRVVIQVWDSLAQLEAFQNSADTKATRQIGDKYAKFRTFAVDGVAQ